MKTDTMRLTRPEELSASACLQKTNNFGEAGRLINFLVPVLNKNGYYDENLFQAVYR